VNSDQKQKNHHFTYFQERYVSFKKMAVLSPEASNAFKLPLFEISILKNKKCPRHKFRICHMVALEAFVTFYPQSKNNQMTSLKNQPIIQPNLQWVFAGIDNQKTSHASRFLAFGAEYS
jgi:hypothetical protein